jgi:L-idonate 5-dehydrogenase
MGFLGSARTFPHVQGGFRDRIVVEQSQCIKINANVSLAEAVCAEPLVVCLHAANQAGSLKGRRVQATGAGPIGSLGAAIAALNQASDIVVTDLHDFTLSIALKMGATQGINVVTNKLALEDEISNADYFDFIFECSGAEAAIHTAIRVVRPRGTIIQVGVTGNLSIPINALVGKEHTGSILNSKVR